MFSIFRKKDRGPLKSPVQVDMHSHLIPGIDDGAKDLQDSLSLIRQLAELGFQKLITTPHIYSELYPNDQATIIDGLSVLRTAIQEENLAVEINAAAEYFLDDHFEELLQKKELLPIHEDLVLVEMSFMAAPPKAEEYIFNMRMKGYRPIMAHPERYNYLGKSLAKFERLKDLGCYFQLNLLSLNGHYGSVTQKTAEKLLKEGMIDFLGTDLHNTSHGEELQELFQSRSFKKLVQGHSFMNDSLI